MHPWTGSRDDIRAVRDGDGISSSWKGIESANGRRLIDLLHQNPQRVGGIGPFQAVTRVPCERAEIIDTRVYQASTASINRNPVIGSSR